MSARLFFLSLIFISIFEVKAQEFKAPSDSIMYKMYMAEGNTLLSHEKYEGAKMKFIQASEIFKDEQAPKHKIQEIDARLARIKEINLKIDTLIKEGDELFASNRLEEAIKKYEIVLLLQMNNTYALNKINEINQLLYEK